MEQKPSAIWPYAAAAAVGVIVGTGLMFALAPGKGELGQARIERDTLNTEIQAFRERIGPLQGEVTTLQERNAVLKSERDRLTAVITEKEMAGAKTSAELGEQQRAKDELDKRSRALEAENETLKKTLAGMREKVEVSAAEREALATRLGDRQRAVDELQQRSQAIAAENEALQKTLAGMRGKMDASAAEREALATRLGAAGRTLEAAQTRAAELNKSYEALLTEKTTLAERAAARRAELETTKKAFEEAQSEVARLMGARGIYTVQNGDSLSTIAAFFYRDGLRWPDIFKANAFMISHPDLIYPKQVLIIPH